jgi:hypothetical protein
MTIFKGLIAVLIFSALMWAGDSPDQKLRDDFARQFAADVEHQGYQIQASAVKAGCGSICFHRGNHDNLRIILGDADVEGFDRFVAQELAPRKERIAALGFIEITVVGMQSSQSYPNGFARIAIP